MKIDFRALRTKVTVYSESDSRWNFQSEEVGKSPLNEFSLRADIVHACSEKLYKMQESLGAPPGDLAFQIIEEWSSTG